MKQLLRGGVVLSMLASSLVFAQDVQMQVDDGEGNGVRMDVQVPAPDMNVRVKVRERTTRTTTTTTVVQEPQTVIVQPAPVAMAPVMRDCGTGNDPGCAMVRDGQYPMDSITFRGFLDALRSNANELTREEMCQSTLSGNYLTAIQLGLVLDLFKNELTRLDVAKVAAPRTVNPGHALGHASKFHNGLLGKDYTEVMSSQR